MIQVNALKINFLYSHEFDHHNHDLVGYVVQKYPHKVVKGSILTRSSTEAWYDEMLKKYPSEHYTLLIGTVSLVGVVAGLHTMEHESGDSDASKYKTKPKDPSAN